MKKSRRNILAAAVAAGGLAPAAVAQGASQKKAIFRRERPANPLFPSATVFGNMVYVSGHGFNDVQGIRAQTRKLLDEIEKILEMAGSSMQKVLKCNVYLADIRDYAEMNEVYRGRFGADPPARTTLSIANIPLKDCLVEIDCTAYI
jgi:enamine deaminase RidA (YjgF/YER057c/UK114 family)